MRIAVLSDIHGNRWALEAVLRSIKNRGIKKMVNLGDCLYGPLDPTGTARILMEMGIPTVCGNEDRLILNRKASIEFNPSLAYVKANIKREHLQWLKKLPRFMALDCLFYLCHGTPERDDDYLLEGVGEKGVYLRPAEEVARKVANIRQSVILCGHSHLPGHFQIRDGPLIVNPGSVGLPAYIDVFPFPHKMETGTPHARYAVLERDYDLWKVRDIHVAYDWETASKTAATNGRPDWAHWLRTGRTKKSTIHQGRLAVSPV
jgi:putative phosphoesterase